jgi:hypothetical protein
MKASYRSTSVVSTAARVTGMADDIHRTCLWALVALLVLIAATGCATSVPSMKQGSQEHEDTGLIQEAPPTRTLEVIDVDADAVKLAPGIRAADDGCPYLPNPLLQIIASRDPAQEAKALGLNVLDDSVQIELLLDRRDSTFLQQAGIEIGKQVGRKVQAYVPIARLCELATDQRVLALHPVSQAETQ